MVHELEISHNKLEEYSRTLEIKVEDRTRELKQKNSELEDTLNKLKQMQKQVIVQEKMATLGQLVAGLTHEFNTPIGAIRSMNDTKSKAVMKLQTALENMAPDTAGKDHEIKKVIGVILKADQLIDQGTERLNEIIKNLKNFARLDEAETVMADIHEGLDSVLALIRHDLLTNIEVVREYSEIPPFVCHARKWQFVIQARALNKTNSNRFLTLVSLQKVQLSEPVLGYLFATRLFKSIMAKLMLKASQEKGQSSL